jgi:hypothetical protein
VDFVSSAFVCGGGLDQEDWRDCREEELTVGWEGGQRAQNNPLYLQSFIDGDDALKFHYIVHSSLDIIEEKGLFFCLMVAVYIYY